MTSPSKLTTMRSPSNKTDLSAYSTTGNSFILQSDATTSDQTAHPTKATSTSLSAATPRTSHLSSHKPASMMEAAMTPNTLDDTKLLTYTADVKQLPDTTDCELQPLATQSSQLDSTLLGKLPRELRDQIYRDAVVEDNDIPIYVSRYETKDGERRRRLKIGHSLLRVCKQTREEVAEMYYIENTFRITNDLFEKRAIRELNRLLTPWAGRMAKLNVSHTFVQSSLSRAQINFSISTTNGRTAVEPESSKVRCTTYGFDVSSGMILGAKQTSEVMCFCKIFKLAMEHDGHDVLSWMQKYVDLVLESRNERNALIHCWTCAGRVVV